MPDILQDGDWDTLLRRIKADNCTPFLGASACEGALPLGGDIARQWAEKYHYPLEDRGDLKKVAQFRAVVPDPMTPKEEILDFFKDILHRISLCPTSPMGCWLVCLYRFTSPLTSHSNG